jgi:hypothetical protein
MHLYNKEEKYMTNEKRVDKKIEIKRDLDFDLNEALNDRISNRDERPGVEVAPHEDDFANWVASHSRRDRGIICSTREFQDSQYCGSGYH